MRGVFLCKCCQYVILERYHCTEYFTGAVADLAGGIEIQPTHLVKALQYRPKIMLR